MKVDVIGSNSLLFANLPPASQVPGRTYRVSNVGPAPGILLTSDGTRYRPAGGRQVLAQRGDNPVTVQNLSGVVAETVCQIPGGLVRSGMQLMLFARYDHSGISGSQRWINFRIGNGAVRNTLEQVGPNNSGALLKGTLYASLDVLSDTNASHRGGPVTVNSFTAAQTHYFTVVDFSQPSTVDIFLTSVAEDPVNISSATWAGGIATFNTAAPHTLAVGDKTVTAGVTPAGWNIPAGAIVLSVPTSTQFTVALAANPGAYTSGGTSSRISNMVSQSYVLELVG